MPYRLQEDTKRDVHGSPQLLGIIPTRISVDILQIGNKVEFARFLRTSLLRADTSDLVLPEVDSRELGFFFTDWNWFSTGCVD
jgi:hypothetical protein